MGTLTGFVPELQQKVDELRERFRIPGVVAAVLHGDDLVEVASGVTNLNTGVPMTTDTVFLIGSITKVWTTSLVMSFVDEGVLDLDVPVRSCLPDLKLGDEDVAARVTLRHFLSHTSGLAGDHFPELGRGDEAVARYVEQAAEFTQLHDLGAMFSYCNSGFVITGRLIERLTGKSFNTVLRERIIEPLGLRQTVTTPEDAMLHRTAVGHRMSATGDVEVWPQWTYPMSLIPAGTSLCSTARELLAFGRLHLDGGRAADGTEILSPSSVKQMQQPHAEIPYVGYGDIGLGWMLLHGYGTTCIGHGGGSPGGLDWLYLLPEKRFGLAYFANYDPAGAAPEFGRELQRFVIPAVAGATVPEPATYDGVLPADLSKFAGTWEHATTTCVITIDGDQLLIGSSGVSHIAPFERYDYPGFPLRPLDAQTFCVPNADGSDTPGRYRFLDFDESGRPTIMHTGLRAFRRVG